MLKSIVKEAIAATYKRDCVPPAAGIKPGDILTDAQLSQCEFRPIRAGDLVVTTMGDCFNFRANEVRRVTAVIPRPGGVRFTLSGNECTWAYYGKDFKRVPDRLVAKE